MTSDNKWGGNPGRAHNLGMIPWNEAGKVPSLSHWQMDVMPFYLCCLWQPEDSEDCEVFRFERRASQDCVGYQPPGAGNWAWKKKNSAFFPKEKKNSSL